MKSNALLILASFLALPAVGSLAAAVRCKLQFADVTEAAGIHAQIHNGDAAKRWIPEANGNGVAWIDYDNDGLMDLVFVNGRSVDWLRGALSGQASDTPADGVYLFHNLGDGHFENVTRKAGLFNGYWATGITAADYDNDGFTDLLITAIGRDLLFHNNGNGTFTEVSAKAGLRSGLEWHTGSAFGDFDGDGRLDLLVTGYIDLQGLALDRAAPVCDYRGQRVFCGPIGFKGGRNILYHNEGDGVFRDVTERSGLAVVPPAHGFTVMTGDFNGDGKLDVLVANDSDPNYLFLNRGDGTFRESALDRGLAFNADGRTQSNMGVTAGEFGETRQLSVVTTTFSEDYFPLFRQSEAGGFDEIARDISLARATTNYFGWACGLTDFDNSGHRDLWTANGHVYPTDKRYRQPLTIFRSEDKTVHLAYHFPDVPDSSYRGAATADFNNDGRMDLVLVPVDGRPVVLQNETGTAGHWIGITLQGHRSNRDAIGAKVTVSACGQTQSEEKRSGGGYISQNDPRLHFGLGACSTMDSIAVKWPSGEDAVYKPGAVDRYITIGEPRGD